MKECADIRRVAAYLDLINGVSIAARVAWFEESARARDADRSTGGRSGGRGSDSGRGAGGSGGAGKPGDGHTASGPGHGTGDPGRDGDSHSANSTPNDQDAPDNPDAPASDGAAAGKPHADGYPWTEPPTDGYPVGEDSSDDWVPGELRCDSCGSDDSRCGGGGNGDSPNGGGVSSANDGGVAALSDGNAGLYHIKELSKKLFSFVKIERFFLLIPDSRHTPALLPSLHRKTIPVVAQTHALMLSLIIPYRFQQMGNERRDEPLPTFSRGLTILNAS